MDESPDRLDQVMCLGCGRLNAPGKHFCEACGAPLTVHATTDPLGTVFAEGYAARRALTQPSKLIVVIGMWLWMLPLAIVSSIAAIVVLSMFVHGVYTFEFKEIIGALLAALPTAVILWISITILLRVTRSAIQAKAASKLSTPESTESVDANDSAHQHQEADTDSTACLMCGQTIAAGINQCSACGWSYSEELEAPTIERP